MKRQKELTSRQWKLYSYLKKQKDYKKLAEIMKETNLYGEDYDMHNSAGSRILRRDIRALKASQVIQFVILSSTAKGIKIATRKEYEEYSARRWKAITRTIQLQKQQDKKAGLDGQVRLVFNQEKDVIEAYRQA